MEQEKKETKRPKRLTIDIPKELHAEIKAIASLKCTTLQRYVLQALIVKLNRDKEFL